MSAETLPESVTPGGRWRNWSRSQTAHPQYVARPASQYQVSEAIHFARDRGLTVRPVGAGHSFTGIAATDGLQLDLAGLSGLEAVTGTSVTVAAGTHLYDLPGMLAPYGLALQNMGDIDTQTVAGAIATGTHGTGARFAGLANQVEALTLVTADGNLLRASPTESPELLPAARIGLGALGVVVDVTLSCVPDFALHAVEKPEPLEQVLDAWAELVTSADHFEFYWFAHTTSALTKTNTRMPADTPRAPQNRLAAWVDDELLPNGLFRVLCELGVIAPRTTPPLNRLSERFVARREVTDGWHEVFTSPRRVRFREMEYALPVEAIPSALREIRAEIERRGWRITFPVEVRVAAADDTWLSTAQGRQTGYLAVHRYFREDPTEYFAAVEAIARAHGGRPHWGKLHSRTAADLLPAYPHFDEFLAVRDMLDPDRVFTNDYLERVLGP